MRSRPLFRVKRDSYILSILMNMPKNKKNKMIKQARKMVVQQVAKQMKPKRKSQKQKQQGGGLELTECSARYAIAISDPWSPRAVGSCVPTYPSRPSYKVRGFLRGVATVGTNGYGFVAIAPTLANDTPCAYFSTSTFNSTSLTLAVSTAMAGTASANMINLPYNRTTLTTNASANGLPAAIGRIVTSGLSIKYIGTELNRSGNVVCFVDPDHGNCNGKSYNDIISRSETEISTPGSDRDKCWVSIYGQNPIETSYPDIAASLSFAEVALRTTYPFSSLEAISTAAAADSGYGAIPMIAWFTGVAGQTFQFEVVSHVEYIGQNAEAYVSPNIVDPDGFNLVQTAASHMYSEKVNRPKAPLTKIMHGALKMAYAEVNSKAALKAGATLVGSLLL